MSGDAPDLRVDVDVTPPVLKLYEPVPDPTQKGTVVVRWHAADRNLATDPITLEWSESADGPWVPVAAGESAGPGGGEPKRIANTGSYAWKVPAGMPASKVYLKARAATRPATCPR